MPQGETYLKLVGRKEWQDRRRAFDHHWKFLKSIHRIFQVPAGGLESLLTDLGNQFQTMQEVLPAFIWELLALKHADVDSWSKRTIQLHAKISETVQEKTDKFNMTAAFIRYTVRLMADAPHNQQGSRSLETCLSAFATELMDLCSDEGQGKKQNSDKHFEQRTLNMMSGTKELDSDFVVKLLNRVVEVREQIRNRGAGSSRIFFPIVTNISANPEDPFHHGSLIVAHVTAIRADENLPNDARLIIAPWSVFVPDDLNNCQKTCTQKIIDVLHVSMSKNEEMDRLRKMAFVVDLQPLSLQDFKPDAEASTTDLVRQSIVWPFVPTSFIVEQDSLGVAIGIAAWAAALRKSVRPVIATGVMEDDIFRVVDVECKAATAKMFQPLARGNCHVIFPSWNHSDFGQKLPDNWHFPEEFKELVSDPTKFLTDGFDEWRMHTGGPVRNNVDAKFDLPLFGHAGKLANHSNDPATGFMQVDLEKFTEISNRVLEELEQESQGESNGAASIHYVTLPYGEDPEVVADWMMSKLCNWWRKQIENPEMEPILPDLAVVLPFCLGSIDSNLPHVLGLETAIAAAFNNRYRVEISVDAFRNAFKAGRAVLVVFDKSSCESTCWNDDRQELMTAICALPQSGNTVVAICSDRHQQEFWTSHMTNSKLEVPALAS